MQFRSFFARAHSRQIADGDEARGTEVTGEHPRLVLADRSVSPEPAVDRGGHGDKQINALAQG